MFEKNNSIKEILKEVKEKLTNDNSLSHEKEEFSKKISKALEGNILILNKIVESDSSNNIDGRSKKITEIVEHQSALLLNKEIVENSPSTLLLSNEISTDDKPLLLNKEFSKDDILLLDNEYDAPYSKELKEIHREIDELKIKSEEKDPFVERIDQLEEKQANLLNKIDEALVELQAKDPSEEIALKFDIFNNQINNEIDVKFSTFDEKNNILEERLTQIETSSENLKNSLENLDFKIEDLSKNLNESLNLGIQEQLIKIEQNKQEQDTNTNQKFDNIESQVKSSIDMLHKYLEEEKVRREEDKKNDPEYQSNLRLNNIYKIMEMQISQSLISNIAPNNFNPKFQENTSNAEVLNKIEKLGAQLSNKVKIDDEPIKDLYSSIKSKIERVEQKVDQAVSSSEDNAKLIDFFKSYEAKNLEGLSFDLSTIKQFDKIEDARSFVENLIAKETQNWIKNNKKNIEEVCKKIIHR